MTLVNSSFRVHNKYSIVPQKPPESKVDDWWACESILISKALPTTTFVDHNWVVFQRIVVARCGGHEVNVHQVIDYAAHREGGVHLGEGKDAWEKAIYNFQSNWSGPGLSPFAITFRSIGRVILNGLRNLKSKVLNADRFEDKFGLSLFMTFIICPLYGSEENYIVDIGSDIQKNRLTVLVDSHGELCIRFFGNDGSRNLVSAGMAEYGKIMNLKCEIANSDREVYVNIETEEWSISRIFSRSEGLLFYGKIPFVLGSDVAGRCRSHMFILEKHLYTRVLTKSEKQSVLGCMTKQFDENAPTGVYFRPGNMMVTYGHPNFVIPDLDPNINYSGDLIAPSEGQRPILSTISTVMKTMNQQT